MRRLIRPGVSVDAAILDAWPFFSTNRWELRTLLAGPVFAREIVTAPRRVRLYVARAAYVAALLVLLSTAWQVLTGTRIVRHLGDLAEFSTTVFQVFAPLQLAVAVFLAAVTTAVSVAQEKDRRTLDLLLITRLSNSELVLGKLFASLLGVYTLLAVSLPVFMLMTLWGGLSYDQIGRVFIVTALAILVAGSLGSTLALWREKTFQTIALTTLMLVIWTVLWEGVTRGAVNGILPTANGIRWAIELSPWHAVLDALRPLSTTNPSWLGMSSSLLTFVGFAITLSVALNGLAAIRIRAWNIAHDARRRQEQPVDDKAVADSKQLATRRASIAKPSREVWDNPILWREVRTWAYGRRTLLLRLAYLLMVVLAAAALHRMTLSEAAVSRFQTALPLTPLFLISLLLVNAQAVTSITSERDSRALDLLLVTDLTPTEFIFGKLAGVVYNTKEMILAPIALSGYLWYAHGISGENLAYLTIGWLVMVVFAAVLGIHAGISYVASRAAIAVSLGTLFFLFVGVATTMRIMVAFSGSFQFQLQPFLAAMVGGGVGLYVALGARNPSPAIRGAALVCPFATFYALTSFLLNYPLAMLLAVLGAYGFTTAAMLVPAIYEFDVATGRASLDD